MFRFKVGDPQQYDDMGNYIGFEEITEPTYYETLVVMNGFVECEHLVSREHLLNRGYIEISESQKDEGEIEKEKIALRRNKKLIFSSE